MNLNETVRKLMADPIFSDLSEGTIRTALEANPDWPTEYRATQLQKIRKRADFNQMMVKAMEPLSRELDKAGLLIRNEQVPWGYVPEVHMDNAFPLLLRWYPLISDPHARERISLALAKPAAANWIPEMIELFRQLRDDSELHATARIGEAVMRDGGPEFLSHYLEIASDRIYRRNRRFFVRQLWKYHTDPQVLPLLVDVAKHDVDDILKLEALYALRRIGDPSTRHIFERYLDHEDKDIRKIAREGIAKVDKAIAKQQGRTIPPKPVKKRPPKPPRPWPHDLPHDALVTLMLADLLKLEDLAGMSERELLDFPGVGPATIARIKQELKVHNLPPLTE